MKPGTRLRDYVIEDVLGQGAMGTVYRARDASGREVALKVLRGVREELDARRFIREATAAAAVSHPNVVRIYEGGYESGHAFMALELLGGGTLHDRLARFGPLPWREAARVGAQLARGLAAMHAAGFVHRDVKPSNVLFDDVGTPKIADFGLVRPLDTNTRLTESAFIVGTPVYLPPEQARGDPVDGQADLYALGCVLYAATAGEPPFLGDAAEVIRKHLKEKPRPLEGRVPDISREFAAIVHRLLAKNPGERAVDAASLARDLDACRAPPAKEPPPARGAPAVLLFALGALVALLAAGSAWFFVFRRGPAAPVKPPPPVAAPGTDRKAADAAAIVSKALALLRDHKKPKLHELDRAIELDPKRADAYAARALVRGMSGDDAGEAEDLRRALALEPRNVWAIRARGASLVGRGRLEEALHAFDEAIAASPRDAFLWSERAILHDRMERPDAALADATRTIELDPTIASGWAVRASARYKKREHLPALADAEKAVELAPNRGDVYLIRGAIRGALNDIPGARLDIDRVIELDPKNPDGWKNRGILRAQMDEPRGALSDFTRALELEKTAATLTWLATVKRQLGDFPGAGADLETALAIDPRYARAWGERAALDIESGRLDDAIANATKAIELDPDGDPGIWIARGQARQRKGDPGAREDLERGKKMLQKLGR